MLFDPIKKSKYFYNESLYYTFFTEKNETDDL